MHIHLTKVLRDKATANVTLGGNPKMTRELVLLYVTASAVWVYLQEDRHRHVSNDTMTW